MTEYGRGPGSEPWNPEDPLSGDGGWGGQQAQEGSQSPYGGQPQHHPQAPRYGDWNEGQQPGYDGQHHPRHDGQYPPHHDDRQRYDQQFAGHAQHQFHQGGWDATGTHGHVPYAADPGDPYGQQPVAYGAEQPDLYPTEDAYPPPEPPGRRRPEPEPADEEESVLAGHDGEDGDGGEEHELQGRRERRGKGRKPVKPRKRRTGCACMVVVLVFGGGLGGVGYFGYQFYQNRFGAAPDYAGDGTGQTVTVEIPKGAGGWEIGRRLKEAGVVKSADAFVHAQTTTPGGDGIQAGAYLLKKEMSAASAVRLMMDPRSQNNVIVTPGERNTDVYAAIDKKLELSKGATRKLAERQYASLGLPAWARNGGGVKDPLEGFLFPGTYPAAKGMKPDAVLRQMVVQAKQKYAAYGLDDKARELGVENAFELVTVASLVQAEGKTHDDFRKMAEVVYNRLKPTNTETNRKLQFDSTYNYAKGTSNIHISEKEINSDPSPYNTYRHPGLPPGPIGNPGEDALKATLNPTHDGWVYFVATDGMSNTEFAKTYAEFLELRDKFNANTGN
ncbi:endolytic transglycosylase MltG [Streptomyces sp. NPDC006658]|uniref:endolytic transglycosylase MltG n=1 Tax=Streptomyces sp. NPDC006658 TaxID=3156900 RepID=UPI0033FD5DB8